MPSPDAGLTPAERNRLVALLGMLGSDHPGEVANAGSLAARMLRRKNLAWDQVVADQPVQLYRPPPPPPSTPEHSSARADLAFCGRHPHALDEWSLGFIVSLSRQRRPFSPKQIGKLSEIAAKLRARGCA